jgi:hypothetical protein
MEIIFKNSNTTESSHPGEGLQLLRERLQPFGAELSSTSRVADATYQVSAIFLKGEL